MKKIIKTIILTSLLICSSAYANTNNIIVVDVEKIFLDSNAGKDLKGKLDKRFENFRQKFSAKESEIQKEKDSLEKQQTILSKEAFDKKVKQFEEKTMAFQKEAQIERNAIERAKISAMEQIDKSAKEVTQKLADEYGFKVVLPKKIALFHDESIDMTDKILESLNKKITKVDLKDTK